MADPDWQDKFTPARGTNQGTRGARMAAHITYLSKPG